MLTVRAESKVCDLAAEGRQLLLADDVVQRFFPPGADTVQGWSTRNSVPGAWSPALFAIAQSEGLIETPMDALVRDFKLGPK